MLSKALEDPDCAGIYGNEGKKLDPAIVLSSISDGGKYGKIIFESHDDKKWGTAQTRPSSTLRPSFRPPYPHYGSVTITINSFTNPDGLYWNDGNVLENVGTLLHELGHAMWFLGTRGAEFKMNDGSDEWNSFNNQLIESNCLSKIKGLLP